jgi:very-short-patch-repair endonuclease
MHSWVRASIDCTRASTLGRALAVYRPDLRFAVELDLFETHGTRAAFERDRLRQEELKLLGIEMIRVTRPRFLCEPDAVLANLATLLQRRRRELYVT